MATDWKGQAQDYGKVNFDFVLMTFIGDINKQLSKLPHESIVPNMNEPVGTTHDDIINSYCDMVHHLAQLLKPYWDDKYNLTTVENETTFVGANMRFGFLMELCERKKLPFHEDKGKGKRRG